MLDIRKIVSLIFCLLLITIASGQVPKRMAQEKRQAKEVSDRVSKLDDHTKRMVNAMRENGVPHSAIADKIKYSSGGNRETARRMVDSIAAETRSKRKRR